MHPTETPPLFKADRKISVSYQGWDARSLSRRTSVKHNSEAAHEIEASAASGKRPSEAAARPIFVIANFVTRLLFVTAPNASRAASNMVILRAKRPQDQREQ